MSSKDNVYRRHLSRVIAGTGYFLCLRDYGKIIPNKGEAFFLQDLINRGAMARAMVGDFFMCSREYLQHKDMGFVWTDYEQKLYLKSLENRGFIQVERRGIPALRWIRIDIVAIHTAIDRLEDEEALENPVGRISTDLRVGNSPDSTVDFPIRNKGILRIPKKEKRNSPSRFPGADAPSQRDSARQREDTPSLLVVNSATTDRESFLPPVADKKTSPSQWDMTTARKLYDALAAKNKVLRGWSKKKWANEFRLLRQFVPTERIESAIQYLAANAAKIGLDEKFPPIHSARKFRDLFGWLEDRMKRDAAQAETPLTPEMKALADNLVRDYRWPKGSDKLVHEAVARSWTALAAFRKKLLPLFESGTKTNAPQHAQFAAKCVRHELIIDSFVQRWMKNLHAELVKWEQWSGSRQSFLNRAVDTDGDAFHKWGRGLAAKWGNSKIWDKLIEEVK